ncbi:MAG: helix-turn-helix domain-containing protein, partial [Brevundimonas sp.]
YREGLRMTQQQLAQAIGVTFQQVQKYERGVNRVAASRLRLIAVTLERRPDDFYPDLDPAPAGASPPMTEDEMRMLQVGDIVRHRANADSVVVTANYGSHAIAVRTVRISNPHEWTRISRGRGDQ